MNNKVKRVMSLMIAVFVAFGMMAFGTAEANAASGKVKVVVQGQTTDNKIFVGEEGYAYAYNQKNGENATVKSVKVTNKAIAKVKKDTYKYNGKKYTNYLVVGKKPGKTKVSIKYKYKGKTSTKKVTLTVKEYPNAIQSLSINGKNITISGDKQFKYIKKYSKKKTKATVKLVPAEGWKISYVWGDTGYFKNNAYKSSVIKNAKTKVKKGTAITYPKKHTDLWLMINLENSSGDSFSYNVELYR